MKVIYKSKLFELEKDYTNIDIATPIDTLNKIKVNGKYKNVAKTSDEYIKIYFIEKFMIDNPNPEQFTIVEDRNVFTNKTHPDYPHLLICERYYKLVEVSLDEVITKLNITLGEHLDREYPDFERDKDVRKLLFNNATDIEVSYISEINSWLNQCRAIRDQKEIDYKEQNIFPNFYDYPPKPYKI